MFIIKSNKVSIAIAVFSILVGITPTILAQQTTEQFIPIGMSPGISNKYSYVGQISDVNLESKSLKMQVDNGVKEFRVSSSTRIWLDRSKVQKSNVVAGLDELISGRTVEIMPSRTNENLIDWIKIETQ